jgi:CheY-like chemotaxis protein
MAKRILLVEDHTDSREVLANLLRRWGIEVETAPDLATALRLLAQPFDAIISDISLPDGTGYAVVKEAKRLRKETLAIALSGYNSPHDIEVGKLAGFDHHLTKPFDIAEIRKLLAPFAG